MIILEQPYVSEFLQRTVAELQIPVLLTEFSASLPYASRMCMLAQDVFFTRLKEIPDPLLYSNSENSAEWLNRYCPDFLFTGHVNYFKDKHKLREIFSALNPDIWYRRFTLEELYKTGFSDLPAPFVIKPVRGFASIGIHSVRTESDWISAVESIKKETKLMRDIFPDTVVSLGEFLIEKYIEGSEIAIDAYFSSSGEPVILNILNHLFCSQSDMSDRLYLTSAEIIRKYHEPVKEYLVEIAKLRDLRNFPFHLEMRQEPGGRIVPIEINPMRFMGFCVADVEYYFYGINPYEYYFLQKKPDWDQILASREGRLYGMFGIDIPKHLDKTKIIFNYNKFIAHFSKPLHHLKVDYRRFPVAIYLFAETGKDNFPEFEKILYSDLSEFIDFVH
jgi:hypothetical protein